MVMVAASCVAPRPVTATTRPKPRSAEPRTAGSQATDEVQLRQRAEQAEKELASFKFRTAVVSEQGVSERVRAGGRYQWHTL